MHLYNPVAAQNMQGVADLPGCKFQSNQSHVTCIHADNPYRRKTAYLSSRPYLSLLRLRQTFQKFGSISYIQQQKHPWAIRDHPADFRQRLPSVHPKTRRRKKCLGVGQYETYLENISLRRYRDTQNKRLHISIIQSAFCWELKYLLHQLTKNIHCSANK